MATKYNLFEAQSTSGHVREAIYNALDTISTLQISRILWDRMSEADRRAHDFYIAMQGPALEMTLRGLKVNETSREDMMRDLTKRQRELEVILRNHELIKPIWDHAEKNTGACLRPSRKDGKHKWSKMEEGQTEFDRTCLDCKAKRMKIRPFKSSSDDDVKHLLYDLWKLAPVTNKEGKVTADKEARIKLGERKKAEKYWPVLHLLTESADVDKQIGFLKFRGFGRFYSSFNIGVTSTHRWSSNKDPDGNGGNAQNITEKHRHQFEADEGYELCYADLKQAESKVIAFVAGDEKYIEAHEGGDTHTYVCRLVWPAGVGGKAWTGDIEQDKVIATATRPSWDDKPGHDWRFQSKAVQHGSNLGLTPFGLAIQKHIPLFAATEAQSSYFHGFPGIRNYQKDIRDKVEAVLPIETPLGFRFKMFGRPWDEHTYKEALAVIPQSMVGHIISIGVYRIWMELPEVQLLAQVHDAILFQFPKGRYDIVYKALEAMTVPIPIKGVDGKTRTIVIGTEAAVGKNWGHYNTKPEKGRLNADGVREITFKSPTEWSIK